MKFLKMFGIVATATMALTALAASSASAYTVEVGGTTQNGAVEISGSLPSGYPVTLARTDGSFANTCLSASGTGTTESPFTGELLGGSVKERQASNCTRSVTIHKDGGIRIEHLTGTTNGTVSSFGAEITTGSPFGTLNCKTNEGTHMGTLTGKSSGAAELHVNAVINCGFLVPSSTLKTTMVVTSPEGLGIVA